MKAKSLAELIADAWSAKVAEHEHTKRGRKYVESFPPAYQAAYFRKEESYRQVALVLAERGEPHSDQDVHRLVMKYGSALGGMDVTQTS